MAQESHKDPASTTSPARSSTVSALPALLPDTSSQQLSPVKASLASSTASMPPPSTLMANCLGTVDIDTRSFATQPTSNPDPMEVDKEKGEETHTSSSASTASMPPPSTLTANGSGAMDINTCSLATQPTSNLDPMEVDKEKGEETHTLSSADVAVVSVPAWLTSINMDLYFEQCSDAKAWQALVQSLYKFEEANTTNGVRCHICIADSLTESPPVEFTDYFMP